MSRKGSFSEGFEVVGSFCILVVVVVYEFVRGIKLRRIEYINKFI